MKQIGSGAEATVYSDGKGTIFKDRKSKGYRIPEIDNKLRTQRTSREANILKKLHSNKLNVPELLNAKSNIIEMHEIEGTQLKKLLDKRPAYAELVGRELTKIHDFGIIHGDLTTSNMILQKDKLFMIDFGLSFYSQKIEDKAVDIHLFKQSLESKHYTVYEEAYNQFMKGYSSKDKKEIIKRLQEVEARGRYKEKI